MVKLRLKRLGRRHVPYYRLAAIEEGVRRDGRVIEELGTYDPMNKDAAAQFKVEAERVKHWLSVGAQPSDTIRNLLKRHGIA